MNEIDDEDISMQEKGNTRENYITQNLWFLIRSSVRGM